MVSKKTMKTVLVLNGPNLNLLGNREPDIYGTDTLEDIHLSLMQLAEELGDMSVVSFHSNHEGELIDRIQAGMSQSHGLIINAGGYTHTSVALRDALKAYPHPVIEVHLSNLHQRETFRHTSLLSPVVNGVIVGLGAEGYRLALRGLSPLMHL